jgi:hypothetical protein
MTVSPISNGMRSNPRMQIRRLRVRAFALSAVVAQAPDCTGNRLLSLHIYTLRPWAGNAGSCRAARLCGTADSVKLVCQPQPDILADVLGVGAV